MTRWQYLETLPYLPFKYILTFLSRDDMLSLSLVSRQLRVQVQQYSHAFQTFRLQELSPRKLRELADLKMTIKELSVAWLADEGEDGDWEESIDHLAVTQPHLEAVCIHICKSFITDLAFSRLASHPGMKSLLLAYSGIEGAPEVSGPTFSRDLESLRLPSSRRLTDTGLQRVLAQLSAPDRLTRLDLSKCQRLTDAALRHIFRLAPSLRALDLSLTGISGEGLNGQDRLIKLESLHLVDSFSVTDVGLSCMLERQPNLKVLHLGWTNITGEAIVQSIQPLKQLEELVLNNTSFVTDQGLSSVLELMPNIRKLDLNHSNITGESLRNSEGLVNLETLCLEHCSCLTDLGLMSILRLAPNLKLLEMSNTNVSGETVGCVTAAQRMQIQEINARASSLTDFGFRSMCIKMFDLRRLDLSNTRITGVSVSLLPPLLKLEALKLRDCNLITDIGLSSILRLVPNIRSLDLSFTAISGESLSCMAPLLKLEELDLTSCTTLRDSGLGRLVRGARNLKYLNLSYTSVTGEGLTNTPALKQLAELRLIGCGHVTVHGVRTMFTLAANLRTMFLAGTSIKEGNLHQLEQYWNRILI